MTANFIAVPLSRATAKAHSTPDFNLHNNIIRFFCPSVNSYVQKVFAMQYQKKKNGHTYLFEKRIKGVRFCEVVVWEELASIVLTIDSLPTT